MTAQLSPTPVQKFFDANGNPLFNGQLFTYAAGTTISQATYVDSTQTTQNPNPIILNARGECNLWLNPTLTYKFVLNDSFGNTIWTVDQVSGSINPNFQIGPPTTGPTLTVNVLDNTTGVIFNDQSPAFGFNMVFQHGGVNEGFIGTGPYTYSSAALSDFIVQCTTSALRFLSATGTIIGVTGASTNGALTVFGNSLPGQSFGLSVEAGTTTADYCFSFANKAATQNYLASLGDGELFMCEPPAAITPLTGTHQVGYMEAPGNTQNGNYTLAITDRGKTVKRTGATGPFTYSIPPASSVAFPLDTIINIFGTPGVSGATVISPGAGVTLTFLPSAATGARTGAAAGFIATIYQAFANSWYIWGSGLS